MTKNITEMTKSELEEIYKLAQKQKDSDAKRKAYNERRRVWMKLMVEKAEKQGITVTEEEINKELLK